MPTTTTVTSNYAGVAAGELFGAAFKETNAVQRGLVTFMPNVKHKLSLKKIDYGNGTTDYSCGFTPAGSITLSENQLTIKMLKNDMEVCKDDFRAHWDEEGDIMEAVQVEVLASQAEKWDNDIWNGDSSVDGQFGGLIPQFEADGDVIKANNGISPAGAAITKTNVLAELEKVTSAFPKQIRKKADFKVLVSSDVALAYEQYLIANGITAGFGGTDQFQSKYSKYMLEEVEALDDNTIIAYRTSNVVVGSSKSNSENELSLVDTSETLLDGNIRGKIVYGADTGYHAGDEIIYYVSTETPA
ncbi:hypothetical protein [Maribacter sp. 2210JD10-5]|uniref:hypothetical protein n=1 Tax=Maribacter sp. 2210JD10-5 TaxID=3386272 RepID=UPI0039BCAC8C